MSPYVIQKFSKDCSTENLVTKHTQMLIHIRLPQKISEGVVAATPTPSHEYLVRWSILNNIPCFVEKPLT